MVKKGDTLIEVTIAVGIFAMVAISIVAVMSGGTSSAQTALETTLAREEIDAQAEALRFIQAAYISDKNTNEGTNEGQRFPRLWQAITEHAITLESSDASFLQYAPSTCADLYNSESGEVFKRNAFIINYRNLGNTLGGNSISTDLGQWVNATFISANTNDFHPATTYPRIIYSKEGTDSNTEADTSLAADTSNYKFSRAEGIYIIAVKDEKTQLSSGDISAFYDFYIRTCWYGTDANQPSTISTVIRLYDPDAIEEIEPEPTTDQGPTYMQDFSSSMCQTKASNSDFTVIDRRNNKDYTVRYLNGKCWMTQDLNIRGDISSYGSNFSSNASIPLTLSTNSSSTYNRALYKGGSEKIRYNFCAASAKSNCTNTDHYTGNSDICPAGWRLPTINEAQSIAGTEFTSDFHASSSTGYYSGSNYISSIAYWWLSSPSDATSSQGAFTYNYNVRRIIVSSASKANYLSIRCVRSN